MWSIVWKDRICNSSLLSSGVEKRHFQPHTSSRDGQVVFFARLLWNSACAEISEHFYQLKSRKCLRIPFVFGLIRWELLFLFQKRIKCWWLNAKHRSFLCFSILICFSCHFKPKAALFANKFPHWLIFVRSLEHARVLWACTSLFLLVFNHFRAFFPVPWALEQGFAPN